MYKNFTLTESEKKQILEQHKNHGYRKQLNEQQSGVGHTSDDNEKKWQIILKALGPTSTKHLRFKYEGRPQYSLNWGDASGAGYGWSMVIGSDGLYSFFTHNPQKGEIVNSLIKKYGLPLEDNKNMEGYQIHRGMGSNPETMYELPVDQFIRFVKEILSTLKK